MTRNRSSATRQRRILHAPDPESALRVYCMDIYIDDAEMAQRGEVVTCRRCLLKLHGKAQYANYLQIKEGISFDGIRMRG